MAADDGKQTLPGLPGMPRAVAAPLSGTLRDYWRDRIRLHHGERYAGARLTKFPEDLRTYEHLMWASRARVVIEIGTFDGGSALWFRDRLRTMAAYGRVPSVRVISIDWKTARARETLDRVDPAWEESITLIDADIRDPSLPDQVGELVQPGIPCFVVDDSAHTYETTTAALRGFARFVKVGGFFVVEDGRVDIEELRIDPSWPRGVLPAIGDWLQTDEGSDFTQRRDLELYGITSHPGGFLQRTS